MGLRKSNVRLIIFISFYVLYVVIGASVFSAIEGPIERTLVKGLRKHRKNFLKGSNCVSEEELERFIEEVVKAANRGISAVRNVTSEPNWSFGQSLFFAGTILTTIGYGHTTPLSDGGKAFCIVYALIGIPLTLIMFTAVVERIMLLTAMFFQFLNRKVGHLYRGLHIRLLHLVIIVSLIIVTIFLIPAAIFSLLEPGWNYLDALYYCFISMTTIGLGDYIPGDSPDQPFRAIYKICTTFYLFIGLIMMMLMLAVIYEVPELNLGLHFYMKSDESDPVAEEKKRLRPADSAGGPKYTEQQDEQPIYQAHKMEVESEQ